MSDVRIAATALFTAALLAFLGLGVWETASKHASRRQNAENNSAAYESESKDRIERDCPEGEPLEIAECVRQIIETSHEHQRNERDLAAQQEMASWALGAFVAAAASAAFTGVGVYFVALTLRSTNRTLEETKNATQAVIQAERPWIKIEDPTAYASSGLQSYSGEIGWHLSVPLKFHVRNFGKTPALRLRWQAGIFASEKLKPAEAYDKAREAALRAHELAPMDPIGSRINLSVFPGDKEELFVTVSCAIHKDLPSPVLTLAVVVFYEYGRETGETTNCYFLTNGVYGKFELRELGELIHQSEIEVHGATLGNRAT